MREKALKSTKMLGVAVNSTSQREVLDKISSSLKQNNKLSIVTPNPEILLQATRNKDLRDALNKADISIADGVGLVWAKRLLYGDKIERIRGRELFQSILKHASDNKLRVYILGAEQKINKDTIRKIKLDFKNLKVEGSGGPHYNMNAETDTEFNSKLHIETLNHIKKFKPDILFIALGAPKQEIWMNKYLGSLPVGIAMVVGGSLDYYVGKMKKPPEWMARAGLEWLWRLAQEPTRIKRIFNAVILFPIAVLREKLKN